MNTQYLRSKGSSRLLAAAALTLIGAMGLLTTAQAQVRGLGGMGGGLRGIGPVYTPRVQSAPQSSPAPSYRTPIVRTPPQPMQTRPMPNLGSPSVRQQGMGDIFVNRGGVNNNGVRPNPTPGYRPLPGAGGGLSALDRFHRMHEFDQSESLRFRHHNPSSLGGFYPYPFFGGGLYSPSFAFDYGPYGYYGGYPYYGYYPPVSAPAPDQYQWPYTDGYTDDRAARNRKADPDAQKAADDIQKAWQTGDVSLLAPYVRRDSKIDVHVQGNKATREAAGDFLDALQNAFQIKTVAFRFDTPEMNKDGDYVLIGYRTVRDDNAKETTIIIAYTLRKMDGRYYIIRSDTE